MRAFPTRYMAFAARIIVVATVSLLSAGIIFGQAQSTAADLTGTVTDAAGAAVPGATVTAKNDATSITRTSITNDSGEYKLLGLPPGTYKLTAEAKSFKKTSVSAVTLTIGQSAELAIKLETGEVGAEVVVGIGDVELVETGKTSIGSTIDQQRISTLPINERSATGFALTLSTVGRDNGRVIGPAPTSGLNVGGQRGRSTQVNVDGADFTDNSTNAARSTVSQDAVQEYQISTNSYTAEFGRATGGVINVVTKRGENDFHGSAFGFIRDKSIQARNAFSPISKPAFNRKQFGATLGGPISRSTKTYFFAAYEGRRRNESGFFTSDVGLGLTSSVTFTVPGLPSQTFSNLTALQATYAQGLLASGVPATINQGIQYLYLASGGGRTALTGTNGLISPGGAIPAGQVIGSRFFTTGAPIPLGSRGANGLPNAFRALNSLERIFPTKDRNHLSSVRFDQYINDNNQLNVRLSYNVGNVSGIQVESQNQSNGQNDFTRTGISTSRDYSASVSLDTILSGTTANAFRFSFGKRKTSFRSQNGEAVAINLSDTAFFGQEVFAPVDRVEDRFQFLDNFNWVIGSHTFKFGGDVAFVRIPEARFDLNFGGLYNFGDFAAGRLIAGLPGNAPAFTSVQSYGLGLPSTFVQGFGNPISKINNKPLAFFAQDSWKIRKNLTINYGIRYDVEFTDTIAPVPFRDPLTGINFSANDFLTAQDAVGVQQGIPRDTNNFAPRFGFAWDVMGDGKTKVSGSLGYYYDHPLLAIAFNSDIADQSQQQQAILTAGSPAPTALLNAAQVFQGTVCSTSTFNPLCPTGFVTPGLAPSSQYLFGQQRFNTQTFTGFGSVLPFSLPITKNFQYASATQANFTLERQIGKDLAVSVSYLFVGAHHLPRPTDLNPQNTALIIQNFQRFAGFLPPNSDLALGGITIATTAPGTPFTNAFGVTCGVVIPGMIAQCPTGRVIVPAVANFFRTNAPNYFLAQSLSGGAVTKAVLDSQLAGTLRTPGALTPFGSVNAQASDGNSNYNAMNLELNKRYANNFYFSARYTWSRSIDDSSDLQTLLLPQDVTNSRLERSDSLFDQRHRFVFSGSVNSPTSWRSGSGFQKFLSDFTISPVVEFSSGRPFNIITNIDSNVDQSQSTDRPSVRADGTLCVPGQIGCNPTITDGRFSSGNLARNFGTTHGYFSVDLGVTRSIRFGEKIKLDLIAQGFNMFNRFNEGAAAPSFNAVNAFGQRASNGRYYSRPTAAFDPRQFQFGVKLNF
jgi:Carboxypeptidase regulatory-like domain/TonB dependent receptor